MRALRLDISAFRGAILRTAGVALLVGWGAAGSLRAAVPELLFPPLRSQVEASEALLLVLEADADGGLRLLSSQRATVRVALQLPARAQEPHASHPREVGEPLLFSFFDAHGEPLLVGRLEVPWHVQGPVLDPDSGEMRCRSVRLPEVVFSPKLPLPAEATEVRLFSTSPLLPEDATGLVAGLRSDPAAIGLSQVLRLRLAEPAR